MYPLKRAAKRHANWDSNHVLAFGCYFRYPRSNCSFVRAVDSRGNVQVLFGNFTPLLVARAYQARLGLSAFFNLLGSTFCRENVPPEWAFFLRSACQAVTTVTLQVVWWNVRWPQFGISNVPRSGISHRFNGGVFFFFLWLAVMPFGCPDVCMENLWKLLNLIKTICNPFCDCNLFISL